MPGEGPLQASVEDHTQGVQEPRCQAWALRIIGKPLPEPRPSRRVLELARDETDPSQLRVGVPAFLPPPMLMGLLLRQLLS